MSPARHIHIEPPRGWSRFSLRELWEFKDLFLILTLRDVALRYKQTVLGLVWVVLQPLAAAVIFAVIFGRLARLPSDGLPYLPFVFAGTVPWNLFAQGIQRAGVSLIGDSNLISKVYFPRVMIPAASLTAVLADFGVGLAIMVALMAFYRIAPSGNLLLLPLMVILLLGLALGVALLLSALNVYYRDFVHATPFVLQVWLYASPVVYSSKLVPSRWRPLFALNPMVGIIDGFRWSFFGGGEGFPWLSAALSVVVGVLLLGIGVAVFGRVERRFADVV
jgi:lipopolysaccharide transport system permease protein